MFLHNYIHVMLMLQKYSKEANWESYYNIAWGWAVQYLIAYLLTGWRLTRNNDH